MSEHYRWSKFFWADWQNDKALQACSLAARGLWLEILAIAHVSETRGHLLINGLPPTPADLADMVGRTTAKEVASLLAELERKRVFSRTSDGTIYCRRMVRDTAASEAGREHISKRWGRDNTAHPSRPPNRGNGQDPNSPPNREPFSQSTEIEKEVEKEPSRSPPAADAAGGSTPAAPGTPPTRTRSNGTNPRATGTNPRNIGTNPRANGSNPRASNGDFVSGGIAVLAERLLQIAEARQPQDDDLTDEGSYFRGFKIVEGGRG